MKHLVKLMYDVANNRKTTVTVNPSSSLDDSQLSKKFFPADTEEVYYYTSELIVPEPDSWSDTDYFYYQNVYPSGDIYSLLKQEVKIGDNPLLGITEEDIVSGNLFTLESAYYSSQDLKNFGYRYGLVYKNEIYEDIMSQIKTDMLSDFMGDIQPVSINKERSLENYIFIVRGKVLQAQTNINISDEGVEISGIKFHSPDQYNIEYYNDIIIPYSTKSTINVDSAKLALKYTAENVIIEPVNERLLTNQIVEETYEYVYKGIDPLIVQHISKTTSSVPYGINHSNYRIIAILDTNGLSYIGFINKIGGSNDSTGGVSVSTSYKTFAYFIQTYSNSGKSVDFFRLRSSKEWRNEDSVVTDYKGFRIIYPCSKGLGAFDSLRSLIAMYGKTARDKLIEEITDPSRIIGESALANYNIFFADKLQNLKDLQTKYTATIPGFDMFKMKAIYDITDLVNPHIESIQTNTAFTTHIPNGKNKSINTIQSARITQTSQDFDNKTFIGNGLEFKTEVYPDNVAKIILGESGLIKNINVDGTFPTKGDLNIIANNFYDNNRDLSTLTVTTKGYIDPKMDIENILNVNNYIIDKVTYDFESNGSVVVLRTADIN